MNRVGQVWAFTHEGEIFLIVSSFPLEATNEWVHGIVFIEREPLDTNIYPTTDMFFTGRNKLNMTRLA